MSENNHQKGQIYSLLGTRKHVGAQIRIQYYLATVIKMGRGARRPYDCSKQDQHALDRHYTGSCPSFSPSCTLLLLCKTTSRAGSSSVHCHRLAARRHTRGLKKGRGVAIEYKRQELVLLRFPWKWRSINELAQARKGAPSHQVWLGFVVLFRMYMLLCVFFVIRISVQQKSLQISEKMFALNKYFDTLPNTPLGLGVRGDGSLEQALPVLLAAAAAPKLPCQTFAFPSRKSTPASKGKFDTDQFQWTHEQLQHNM